eukprot:UN04630
MNDDGSVNQLIWECGIPGKANSGWAGGVYPLTITFCADISQNINWRKTIPQCVFEKGLFHPNVYVSGNVCLCSVPAIGKTLIQKLEWKADIHDVKILLLETQQLMTSPHNDDPAAKEPYELYKGGERFYWNRVCMVAKRYQIDHK